MRGNVYLAACEVREAVHAVDHRVLELRVELERTNAVLERLCVAVEAIVRWIELGPAAFVGRSEGD